jgi:hypothetical protein
MPRPRNVSFLVNCTLIAGMLGFATGALAHTVSRERDIGDLRLGQKVMVDDGSCPAGQIKEVQGSQMTASGVLRTSKCIPRLGTKKLR